MRALRLPNGTHGSLVFSLRVVPRFGHPETSQAGSITYFGNISALGEKKYHMEWEKIKVR